MLKCNPVRGCATMFALFYRYECPMDIFLENKMIIGGINGHCLQKKSSAMTYDGGWIVIPYCNYYSST